MDKNMEQLLYFQRGFWTGCLETVDADSETFVATKATAEAMVKDGIGKYHYDYIIPDDAEVGLWKTEVKATSLTVAVEHDKFEVVERL